MYLEEFQNYLIVQGFSNRYKNPIKIFLEYSKNKIDLKNIVYNDINNYILFLKQKQLSNSYINSILASIKCYYKFLFLAYPNEFNPNIPEILNKFKYLPIEHKRRDYLTKKELDSAIGNIITFKSHRINRWKLKALLYFMFFTGVRISELTNLKRQDIDLEKNCALIRIPTKNKKERYVYFTHVIGAFIKKYFSIEPENINAFNVTFEQVRNIVRKLRKYLPGKKISIHSLRHCISEDTEIFTFSGWKKYNELNIGDKIYNFDFNTNKIVPDKIKNLHIYDFKENLYHLKNSKLDCLITEEHKIPVSLNLFNYNTIKRRHYWTNTNLLSVNEIINKKSIRLAKYLVSGESNGNLSIGINKAFILGLIMTDGNINSKNRKPDITIAQSYSANKDKCEIILKHLKESGLKFSAKLQKEKINTLNGKMYQMMIFRIFRGSQLWIFDWLNSDGSPKMNIFELKQEELKNIYQAMFLADGSKAKYANSGSFTDQNPKIIEFFRMLCVFIGYNTTTTYDKTRYRTYISYKDRINFNKKQIKKVFYKGKIWCPETLNGNFIAKRNNKIYFTGNSFAIMLATNNIGIRVAQKLLGQNNINSTLIYYNPDDKLVEKIYRENLENIDPKKENKNGLSGNV